jgi:phi13 family phage major tail protein
MPQIGLKYLVYAKATETSSSISYANGGVMARAIKANIAIETNDAKLYSDDAVSETDQSFASGKININADDIADAVKVALLGYAEGAQIDAPLGSKELSSGALTVPPFVGVGFYAKRVKSAVNSWRAIWLKKVQFKEPADEFETKGQTVQFQTPSFEGTIMLAADDKWKEEGTFSTEAAAKAWLDGKAGISSATSNNITVLSVTNGTLTPVFAQATRNYSCVCTGNIDLTATFAAGTARVYVDGTYTETLATTVKGGSITMAAGTSKIVQIVVQESGKSPITYTIMCTRA